MTKKFRKSLIVTSAIAAMFSIFGIVASMYSTKDVDIQAYAETATEDVFEMKEGASIRLHDPSGLRFKIKLSESKKNEIFDTHDDADATNDKKLGMFIFPEAYLDDTSRYEDGAFSGGKVEYSKLIRRINISFDVNDLYQQGDYWYANGVNANMFIQNYNLNFVAVGYIKNPDGTYEYTDYARSSISRSISYVATEAYNAGEYQDRMANFIEKSIYTAYGVKATKVGEADKTTGVVPYTYSYKKGNTAYEERTYEELKADLPIGISVAGLDEAGNNILAPEERLKLQPTITVNGTKVDVPNLPLSYNVEGGVACEDGTLLGAELGTGTLTVSLGSIVETSAYNISVEGNTVRQLDPKHCVYKANKQAGITDIDLSTYGVVAGTIDSVSCTLDGKSIAHTLNGTKLSIAESELEKIPQDGKTVLDNTVEGGEKEIKIVCKATNAAGKQNTTIISGTLTYINYAISTALEFNEFQIQYREHQNRNNIYTYVVLENNLNLGGSTVYSYDPTTNGERPPVLIKAGTFYGCFDGQGYTISNFKISNSLMYRVGYKLSEKITTFKNVGFTNCTKQSEQAGGILCSEIWNAEVSNVYVNATATPSAGAQDINYSRYTAAIADYAYTSVSMTNCFVEFTQNANYGEFKTYAALVARGKDKPNIQNCYAVSDSANVTSLYNEVFAPIGDDAIIVPNTENLYTSAEFTSAITSLPTGFDANYWAIQNGKLTFKTASNQALKASLPGMQVFAKNRGETLSFDLSKYGFTASAISSVTIGGTTVPNSYNNGTLTLTYANIPSNVAKHTELDVVITGNDNSVATAKIMLTDFAIGNVDELNAFGRYCASYGGASLTGMTPFTYAILTADINYNDGVFSDVYNAGYFYGIFDGQGYTIRNLKVKNSFFYGIRGENHTTHASIVKNLALVNVIKHTGNGGGLLTNELTNALVDNVYVSGVLQAYANTSDTGYACGAACNTSMYATIKNSVFKVEYEVAAVKEKMPALMNWAMNDVYVENVSVISSTSSTTLIKKNDNADPGATLYRTVPKFKEAVTERPNGFNAEYWEMLDNTLTFSALTTSEIITIDKTFVSAKNRVQSDLVIDLAGYPLVSIDSVTVQSSRAKVPVAKFAFERYNSVVIKHEDIPEKGLLDVFITARTLTGDIVVIDTKAQVVDFAIGTVAEWEAFGAYCSARGVENATEYTYVILTADINYQGKLYSKYFLNGAFNGVFDGQGHTISNIMIKHSIFYGIGGVSEANPAIIKNVAFVNVVKGSGNGGGFIANMSRHVVYENIYLTGRSSRLADSNTTAPAPALFNYAMAGFTNKINNCVFMIRSDRVSEENAALYRDKPINASTSGSVTANNVYVIADTCYKKLADTYATTDDLGNSTLYGSLDLFKDKITSLGDFDSKYWTMQNGILTFKSAIPHMAELNVWDELEGDSVSAGTKFQVILDNKWATMSVAAVDGYTLDGISLGIETKTYNDCGENAIMHVVFVTVADSVANGTQFKIEATYTDVFTGEEKTTEKIYTVTNA